MFTQEQIREMEKRVLKPDDRFRFGCSMCGACCKNRKDPIILNGGDVFRMAGALNVDASSLAMSLHPILGASSHIPILLLPEREEDGRCVFLGEDNRCEVEKVKPAVCALFPLGRMMSSGAKEIKYFYNGCDAPCDENGREWTLTEWLKLHDIEERTKADAAFFEIVGALTGKTVHLEEKEVNAYLFAVMLHILYGNYDAKKDFFPQAKVNLENARMLADKIKKGVPFDAQACAEVIRNLKSNR